MDPAFNCTFTMCSCPSTLQKEFISKDKKQDGIMLYTLSYSKNKTDLRIVKQLQYIYVSVHICVYIQEYSIYFYYILQYIHR